MTQNALSCYKAIWNIKNSFPDTKLFPHTFFHRNQKKALPHANTSTWKSIFVFDDLYQKKVYLK